MFLDRTDIKSMDDESDDEVPPNWEAAKDTDGNIFYVNHELKKTQWEHPITKRVKFVAKGNDQ